MPAELDAAAGTASGVLPDGTTVYYFNLIDRRGLVASTEHYELSPSHAAKRKPSKPHL